MPWLNTSKTLIIKHQAYTLTADAMTSSTLSDMLDQQMDAIESDLPDLIPVIEADLATLETLDALLTTEQGSANSTLVRADVIQWSDRVSKTSGIEARYVSLRQRIALLLSGAIADNSSSGQGCLMRG